MLVLVFGRTEFALDCIKTLLQSQIEVIFIPSPVKNKLEEEYQQTILDYCQENKVKTYTYEYYKEYKSKFQNLNIDYIFSALHSKIFKTQDLKIAKSGVINFHASPTPPIRGFAGFTQAFLYNMEFWGATSFFIIDEGVDNGPIIDRATFLFDWKCETAFSLKKKTYPHLVKVLNSTIKKILAGDVVSEPQEGEFVSLNKTQFEENKLIGETESIENIERKVRGYWFPPYEGATIELNNKRFTLLDPEIIKNKENFE